MRRTLLLGALAGVLACGFAQASPSITGLWSYDDDKGVIQIDSCGAALCGRLVGGAKLTKRPDRRDKKNQDPALRERPLKGLTLLSGFTGGPQKWTGGRVYNPGDGRTYKGELVLRSADTLEMKGCVVKPLCRSQTLTRVH